MFGFDSPLSRGGATFDDYDEYVPEHLPEPGPFLDGHPVLTGDEHVAFHRVTRAVFEERGVYDVTFDYNLARLNLDRRHENAGFRYAEESDRDDDRAVLRAEFTPTTAFCPQTTTLTEGAFRAWNGLDDRHEYDLVRVRADPSHHDSESVNERLRELEAVFVASGDTESDHDSVSEQAGDTESDHDSVSEHAGDPASDGTEIGSSGRSDTTAPL
jgi:hypothetical protein